MFEMEKMQRVEGADGRGEYSRPVMLIGVGGCGSGKCLFDGADEADGDSCCGVVDAEWMRLKEMGDAGNK